MTMKKLKPYLVTSGVVLGTLFVLNTVANRVPFVRDLRDQINQGA